MEESIDLDVKLLLKLRTEKGWTTKRLATYLGYKTATGYWLIENGERKIPVSSLYKLSKLYKTSMENFFVSNEAKEVKNENI